MLALFRRAAILGVALTPVPVLAAPAVLDAIASAPVPAAQPYQFDLKVDSGGAALKAGADLVAQFPWIETSLNLAVEADPHWMRADPLDPAATGASRETLGLKAAWIAPAGLKLNLALNDVLGQTWSPEIFGLTNDHLINTDDRGVSLGVSLSPLRAIDVSLTGTTSQKTVLDIAQSAAVSESQSQLSTATQSAAAGLKWRLFGWFTLNAAGRVETSNAIWRGNPSGGAASGASLAYADFAHSVSGAVTLPWDGKLGLTFEHAVSPIDPGAFATFAAIEDRADTARFGPNREWRYRLDFDQNLAGQVKLTAALISAHIESATELGPVGLNTQAPISVSGGERQEADVALSVPLTGLGLPSLTLKGSGAWRNSQLRDPFTGDLRRASAESPQTGQVGLEQALSEVQARWGLVGHFGGDQSLYQMSQVTMVNVADSLGGFLEYDPGRFALRLQVDGLYGGDRTSTDFIYAGSRASGYLDHIDRRTQASQAVRLILKKSL